jgi:hypothetical protein
MTHNTLSFLAVVSLLSGGIHSAQCQQPDQSKREKAKNQWPSIKRLVESKDLAGAAKLAVEALEGDYPDRQYAMWKWWETTFGDRKDFMEFSRRFGECLFDIYEHSPVPRRRVIAETFGHPEFDVSKSAADFRAEVEKKPKGG